MKPDLFPPQPDPAGASLPMRLTCFRVGKADAFLITTPRSRLLIDAGPRLYAKELVRALIALGVTRLDYLIFTHFHADHIGGAGQILKNIPVEQVLQSPLLPGSKGAQPWRDALKKAGIRPECVATTQQFLLDGVVYTLLPPRRKHYEREEANNASLLIHLRYGGVSFLFTGDARQARLREYLSLHPGRCDVLKVPHHGRYQPILPTLLQTITPRYAVITSAPDRLEDPKTLVALHQVGCQTLLTRNGTVLYCTDGRQLLCYQ